MKASEFIGKTVIDKKAVEVGRVSELSIEMKKCLVDKIVVSTGSAFNKKYFAVTDDQISEVGDYLQLALDQEQIEELLHVDKVEQIIPVAKQYKELVGKLVISQDAMEVGKVEDVLVEQKGCLVHNMIISTGSALRKKPLMVSDKEIKFIGDYVILDMKKEEIRALD